MVLLRLLTYAFSLTPLGNPAESIHSGNYGHPPKTTWWLKQSFIYFLGLLGMKFCVFVIFQLCPWIVRVGDWALKWTYGNETLQIFFVMLFFPVVMNALQYYIIDGFIKNQNPPGHEPVPSEDGDSCDGVGHRRSSSDHEEAEGVEIREESTKDGSEVKIRTDKDKPHLKVHPKKVDEYNPAVDGEGSGGSGEVDAPRSSSRERGMVPRATTAKEA